MNNGRVPPQVADLLQRLGRERSVAGLGVFGSAVRGDIWPQSDFDVLVVVRDQGRETATAAYVRVDRYIVHLQVLSKSALLKALEAAPASPLYAVVGTAEFLVCRDQDLVALQADLRRPPELYCRRRSTELLGLTLKELYRAEKQLHLRRLGAACHYLASACRYWTALTVIESGSYPDREVAACTGGRTCPFGADELCRSAADGRETDLEDSLGRVLKKMRKRLLRRASAYGRDVVDYLKEQQVPLSSVEVEKSKRYRSLKTDFRLILEFLVEAGVVNRTLEPLTAGSFCLQVLEEKYYI